ncbi:hypothetical protein H6G93_17960 [Nostoc sp. FACHB-973]|nr:hypothetical protein [Nostoc sp. FACHB-973]
MTALCNNVQNRGAMPANKTRSPFRCGGAIALASSFISLEFQRIRPSQFCRADDF